MRFSASLKTSIREWMVRKAKQVLHTSIVARAVDHGHDRDHAEKVTARWLGALDQDVMETLRWNRDENAIIANRLKRRFDPGMCLNEVVAHARAAHAGSAALDHQRDYLQSLYRQG